MLGVYFSGTGNSRYALERFLKEYDSEAKAFSIEEKNVLEEIRHQDILIFSYPVQYSNIPKILYDFIITHKDLWNGKKVFVLATMGMFSGDGAGILARLLKKYGAQVLGGLHIRMPDSICDEKVLKRPMEENKEIVRKAEEKIKKAVADMKCGKPTQEGIGLFYHLAGLLGQRLYFGHKTKHYTDKLKIDHHVCIGCGRCEKLCPMSNIRMENKKAVSADQCTMCYRCVNQCPKQAITLLGKNVVEQGTIGKYL